MPIEKIASSVWILWVIGSTFIVDRRCFGTFVSSFLHKRHNSIPSLTFTHCRGINFELSSRNSLSGSSRFAWTKRRSLSCISSQQPFVIVPEPSINPSNTSTIISSSTNLFPTAKIGNVTLAPFILNNLLPSYSEEALDVDRVRRDIDRDFLRVSFPAFLSLAAEPLVSIVDASFVGRLGAVQQAGVGIASSAQVSISKLYNDPLLKTTTSLVAGKEGEDLAAAVSTAISSAAVIGSLQALAFLLFSGQVMHLMGVPVSSSMRRPAMTYLRWRAVGIPAYTLLLVTNGIFRGRGDTKTPLYCNIAGNLVNIVLDPLLMFGFKMGCAGTGAALAVSQWMAALPLLYLLHRHIPFNVFEQNSDKLAYAFRNYFKAGVLILVRTITKISAYTVTASAAAKLGPISMAAYSLTFSLGFTAAQLCESVAIAAQAFLAKDQPFDTEKKKVAARHVIARSLQIGLGISVVLISTTLLNFEGLLGGMTSSPEVRRAAKEVMPIVLFAQFVKGVSSSTGSILLGGCDWVWSSLSMNIAASICVGLVFTLPKTLQSLWIALAAFMSAQVVVAAVRIFSGTGPWSQLYTRRVPGKPRPSSPPVSSLPLQ